MSSFTIIGTGNMGTAIGGVLADGGSAVEHVSHDAVGTAPLTGDFVVLAVPYPAVNGIIDAYGDQFDGKTVIGRAIDADAATAGKAVTAAAAGFRTWTATPVETRAVALEKAADLLEERLPQLLALLALEAGKTLSDGIAEVREAVHGYRRLALADAVDGARTALT